MRLSTSTIYAMGTRSILDQQSRLAAIGQKLASDRRIVTPADDPNGATRALTVSHAIQVNEQYKNNRSSARQHLSAEENQLNIATNALGAAKPLLVKAVNGTLSDTDRTSVATELQGVYDTLLAAANAQDGSGRYIFAGFATDKPSFQGDQGSVVYAGDAGRRDLPVDGSQRIAINDPGSAVFAAVTPNAKYVGTADNDNQGSGVIGDLRVTDASANDAGHAFTLKFAQDAAGNPTYSVVDQTTGTSVATNQPFHPGQPIALGTTASVTVSGTPAVGDRFTVGRGLPKDNNILDTLAGVISKLKTPTASDPKAAAALTNTLNAANRQLDDALDNVLTVRASVGSRRKELETLDTAGANQQLSDKINLSNIQDLDQISAVSDLSLAKVALQASEQTFALVQKLSLFNLG